jgi:CO dehydrogenase/acetyl-CoA synthase beta subunit
MTGDDWLIEELKTILSGLKAEGLVVKSHQVHPVFELTNLLVNSNERTFITRSNTAIELGHPACTSLSICMITERDDLVTDCRITVFGQELQELAPGRYHFALIVLTKVKEANETSRQVLLRKVLSCDHFKGTNIRTSSGKVWIRFSEEALAQPLTLVNLGWFLLSELKKESTIKKVEIGLAVAGAEYINKLKPIADSLAEKRNLQYRATLVEKMECETGFDCETCPETETCKILKDAVAIARKSQKSRRVKP